MATRYIYQSISASEHTPESLAALAMKYGGSSPMAVPIPQQNASTLTLKIS